MSLGTQESRRDVLSAQSNSLALMLKASMKFEIATAVSIGSVGATGPSAEIDLKTKTGNYRTKRCSRQQPQNHLVLYTTGTDSIQPDRPLSKID